MYTSDIDQDDTIIEVDEFKEHVKSNFLTDYDGHGYPVKKIEGNYKSNANIVVLPSKVFKEPSIIPSDATHIVWYNK